MKKIIALILVVVLSFGVCSISFASGIEDDNNDYSWELSQIEGAPKIERWKYTSDTSQGCLVDGGQYIGNASVTGNKELQKLLYLRRENGRRTPRRIWNRNMEYGRCRSTVKNLPERISARFYRKSFLSFRYLKFSFLFQNGWRCFQETTRSNKI